MEKTALGKVCLIFTGSLASLFAFSIFVSVSSGPFGPLFFLTFSVIIFITKIQ